MKLDVGPHPDELLDRAAAGAPLTRGERALLSSHLRGCTVCGFLQAVKTDLRREEPPGAERALAAALVASTLAALSREKAVEAARSGTSAPPSIPAAPPMPRPPRRIWRGGAGPMRAAMGVAAAAIVGLGGLALAGHWQRARERHVRELAAQQTALDGRTGLRHATTLTPTPALDAPRLFAEARDARLRGDAAETRRLYQALWERFASTPEAQAGRVIFARWLLDGGEPGAALPAFSDYLRVAPSGALDEEARVGLAESYERLGDERAARLAWAALLARHPASAHAARAQQRLRALAGSALQAPPSDGSRP